MDHTLQAGAELFPGPFRISDAEKNASLLVLAMFFFGVLAGAAVGMFSAGDALPAELSAWISEELVPGDFFDGLRSAGQFPLVILLCSTSLLGVVLIPAAVFLRAGLLSCSVAALFSAFSYKGLVCAFLARGIPALLSVPALLLVSCDCLLMSQNLLRLKLETRNGPLPSRFVFHLFFTAAAVLLEAWYDTSIAPALVQTLFF